MFFTVIKISPKNSAQIFKFYNIAFKSCILHTVGMPITRFEDYIADRFDTMKIWVEFLGEIFITVKKQKVTKFVFLKIFLQS